MRTELKVLRTRHKMTQGEFADKLGLNRANYAMIEIGKRNGTMAFWNKIQTTFNIPENDMWSLMKNEEE